METITKKCCLVLLCALLHPLMTQAQELLINGQDDAYPQAAAPALMAHYQNNTIFATSKSVQNLRGGQLLSSGKGVNSLAVSPTGNSFAIVKDKVKAVTVYDLWNNNRKLGSFKLKSQPTGCAYTADGTRLLVADETGQLSFVRLRDYRQMEAVALPFAVNRIVVSDNGEFMAATDGGRVVVLGMTDKVELANLSASSSVTDLNFSAGSKELAVLSSDGQMVIYDTRTFSPTQTVKSLGEGRACDIHPDGKYVSVVTGDSRISLVNLVNDADRLYVNAEEGGVTDAFFAKDSRGVVYLVYNTEKAIHYKQMNELPPYLTKMLDDEVAARMAEWEKRMPEETDEEYMMRVNDETRAAQMRLFEEEVATRMADEYATDYQMTLGNYNPETNMMALDFDDMPTIYIDVPKEDLHYFMNPDDIEIRNPIYGVGENDKFELLYADIYNKNTGKTYTFDNRTRQSLDYLAEDNGFLPLEVAQQGAMDEMKLDEMKNDMVSTAMMDNKLSDATKISVSTNTQTEVDDEGNRHINYKVSFGYQVEGSFSEREDFAPGRYKAEQSAAAQTMLGIINKAMQTDFAQYVKEGKKVKIITTGSADASPIKKALPYSGEYGEFKDAPAVKDDYPITVSVNKASGIVTNEQLAFLRAQGMQHSMKKNVKALEKMDTNFETHIEQATEVGGQYRRIRVDYIFVDAF